MPSKKYLGTITILVKDRQTHAQDVQQILTDNGRLILARLGVNAQRSCVQHCTGLITIMVEGTSYEINRLTKQIDSLYGIVAKAVIVTG
ncbi:MAG: hypothetical protein U9R06_03250 [Patescibacteria group bacterium]|nr:hypothetical protein [Patescibacteria group bacterium]